MSSSKMSNAKNFILSTRNDDRTQEWIMTGGGSQKFSGKYHCLRKRKGKPPHGISRIMCFYLIFPLEWPKN